MPHILRKDADVAAAPVHRWLRFADGWSERAVHRALDVLRVRRKDVIYDPFVGCGTTPVASAGRGHRTVSMDHSALAVLATVVKLYPPDPPMLDEIAEKLRTGGPCGIQIRKLQVRRLRRGAASPAQRTLVFALMAGWLRARGRFQPLDREGLGARVEADADADARWLGEALRVVDDMRADIPAQAPPASLHVVRCREFAADAARLPGITPITPIVMVTSPPLPVRHVDTDRQRLDRLIHTTVPRLRIFDRHDHHTDSPGAAEMRRVSTYDGFLDSLLSHAQNLGCTSLAIEVSSRPAPNGVACDELLVSRLPAFGFKLMDVFREDREPTRAFAGAVAGGSATHTPHAERLSTVCAAAVDEG
jgi:hypothetical protein